MLPLQVDDMCAQQGVALSGPGSVDWVLFRHPGWSLLPIEVGTDEQVDCAAAWVPNEAVAVHQNES